MRGVTHSPGESFLIAGDDELDLILPDRPFPELQHLGEFVGGVDMQDRKRQATAERLESEP